ncbi:hypothetical protein KUV23_06070 [Algoriphagus marincola]|uniref:Plasmid replication protein RepL domain-containing protein n=1 Tax=Algoriphagus marincola TaxID=264027 RepID=A0ABS7N3E5_9BACT|nr:hypothetical protein [Algoriphagus marincola]MBY5950530.1 hypothetical protein [Algoriphagus marincola]
MRRIKYTNAGYHKAEYYNPDTLIIPEEKFFTYFEASINFHHGAFQIITSLSITELKVLYYIISNADKNFLIQNDDSFKQNLNLFFFQSLKEKEGSMTVNPSKKILVEWTTINKIFSVLRKKNALIKYPGQKTIYFVNPYYFSRSDLDRHSALELLLKAGLLEKNQHPDYDRKRFHFENGKCESKKDLDLLFIDLKEKVSKQEKRKAYKTFSEMKDFFNKVF